ncbi:MAG: GspH/FimT family pseudopilin [Planctomycetota bacterium]|jgi:type II secretory pathway pseudopilin PulG
MMPGMQNTSGVEKVKYRWIMLDSGFGQEGKISQKFYSGGFSLIEILIVVGILMIAAMMVVPMMSSADSFQLRSAANIVAADLEYAKSIAITRGENFKVIFEPFTESYRIEDTAGNVVSHPVKKGFDYVMDFANEERLGRVKIDSVNFNSTNEVEFDCLGSPNQGGTVNLEADGEIVTVNVEPVTGFISITN